MPLASRVLEAELDPAPQAEVVRTPESGSWWWTALAPVVFGLLVYAPWLRSGRLFAYDWISGPYDRVPPATFGLREGRASVAPVVIARRLLGPLLGGVDPVAVALVLSPLLLAWGLRGLLGRSPRAWLPALALAAINPYLYQHLSAGAFGLVLAASMLPLGWSLAIRTLAGERAAALKLALTVAVQTAFAPQYVLFGLIPIGALVVVRVLRSTSRRRPGSPLGVVLVAGCLGALSAYWIVPTVRGGFPEYTGITSRDLAIFATAGRSAAGALANIVSLVGYWRADPRFPAHDLSGWPLFLLAILAVAVVGLVRAWQRPEKRELAMTALLIWVVGVFLSMGGRGPTGPVFEWMFDHLPGFKMMREPGKAVVLVALGLIVLYGLGASELWTKANGKGGRAVVGAALVALPCVYGSSMLFGLHGRLSPTHVPASWQAADKAMGTGTEKVLALPWHQYLSYPWTGDRPVQNPTVDFFRRSVVSGDNLELPGIANQAGNPRSAYLEFLFKKGPQLSKFGNLLAPLDIKYVLLEKTVDWPNYAWLDRQTDLRVVGDWKDARLYQVTEPTAVAHAPAAQLEVADWGQLVWLSNLVDLTSLRIRTLREEPGIIRPIDGPVPAEARPADVVTSRRDATTYRLSGRDPIKPVTFGEPFDPAWRLGNSPGEPSIGGTTSFDADPAHTIRLTRAAWARDSIIVSVGALVLCLLFLLFRRLRPATDTPPS